MTNAVSIAQSGSNNVTFRNRIINGAMVIDQRNAGASVATTTTSAFAYTLDRWAYFVSVASKFTVQRTPSAAETGYATRVGAGFTNYLAVTSTSSYTSGASEIFLMSQCIEGFNFADMAWGTANAKTVTLSFLAYSSITGTHSGSVSNSAGTQTYPFTFTVSSANTWTQVSITIPGSTSGTWATDNSQCLYLFFNTGCGSSKLGTANAWSGTVSYGVTGSVSVVGTNGATFYITGVQLEAGTTASPFEYRQYGTELALCQRYYEVMYADTSGQPIVGVSYNASNFFSYWYFKQEKRSSATVAVVNGAWTVGTPTIYGGSSTSQFYKATTFYLSTTSGLVAVSASAEL